MATVETIQPKVKTIVVEQLDVKPEEVVNSANFVDDLGADSLSLVEIIMAFEEEFDVEIPDEESTKMTTIQSAIDFIAANVPKAR